MGAVTVLLGLTAAFAAANPVAIPQLFDFDVLDDIPAAPSPSIVIGAASQVVTYDAASMIAAATVAPLNTPTPSVAQAARVKRDDIPLASCYGGTPQPTGAGPIASPDTPEAFAAYAPFASIANAASTPAGYVQTFKNYNASAIALGYLGYTTFQSYDVDGCAAKCNSITNCHAFDICNHAQSVRICQYEADMMQTSNVIHQWIQELVFTVTTQTAPLRSSALSGADRLLYRMPLTMASTAKTSMYSDFNKELIYKCSQRLGCDRWFQRLHLE